MTAGSVFMLLLSSILVNNFVLSRFLGCCPFLGVSKRVDTAFGMGMAVTFVMALTSLIAYLIEVYILVPLEIEYLRIIVFILVIAGLVQFVEMAMKKITPALYQALGVYLPLITTNCAVLGVAILNVNAGYNLILSLVSGIGGALGFMLAIVLFAGIRERMATAPIAKAFDGFPIALIAAGLMSVAFLGFQGLFQ